MFIRTEMLFLRPGWAEDAPELAGTIGDEAIVRNLARVPWPYREEHARAWLSLPKDPRLPSLLVTLPGEGGRIVGNCGLHEEEGEPAVGYWIAREHQDRGYATEAARALIGLARVIGHRRVRADHFADNPASGRVLRKCGFVPTGRTSRRPSLARGVRSLSIEYVAELADCPARTPDSDCLARMPEAA